MIEQERLPVFEPIVSFQERFGGIEYRVGRSLSDGFLLGITWDEGLNGFKREDGRYFFECAEHPSAPFRFFLDQDGVFYVKDFPLATHFETYLEADAIFDEMAGQGEWHSIDLGEVSRDDRRINAKVDLPIIPEASDIYMTLWGNDKVRVSRLGYWAPEKRLDSVMIYARTRDEARQVRAQITGLTSRSGWWIKDAFFELRKELQRNK